MVLYNACDFKNTIHSNKTRMIHPPHPFLAVTVGFVFFVGACTSTSSPISQDVVLKKPQEETGPNNSQHEKASPSSNVTGKSPSLKEPQPAPAPPPGAPSIDKALAKGKSLYQKHCANCHGFNGDGQGPLAADLSTKPQNFTKGEYKFRSTMSGELPTDTDLFRTITVGIPGTAMESYRDLPQSDRMALVAYLKSFSPRFLKSLQGTPIILPNARPQTPESVTHGSQLYDEMQCSACHGANGKGDGELAHLLNDTAGNPIPPANLTRKKLKSGEGPEAIYRTIMTGLDGTPMPSYGYALDPEDGWDLAIYIYSLANRKETQ